MRHVAILALCIGFGPGPLLAQSDDPTEAVIADTYIRAFPDTGARIAVFEAGPGFREELFAQDTAGIFDRLMPGQPPLTQADIIVARVSTWTHAAEVYDGTPLQNLSDAIGELPESQPVFIRETEMFGAIDVLTFTFLNEAGGETIHARCMARFVVETLYVGAETEFDLAACSRELG